MIVGAGLAGAKAAEALRQEGFDGRVVLLGQEPEPPYHRPPLSKGYLRGETSREQAHVHPAGFYAGHDIELRTAAVVDRLDVTAGKVELAGGEWIGYDRLLLATGAEPRRLPVPGSQLGGVHHLRDFQDADAIATDLARGGHLVVVGGGFIGAEVAASARQRGLEVTLVERGPVPLGHVLGREVGGLLAQLHRDHGVELVTGATVEGFEGSGRVGRVRLAGGTELECDLAVVGVGVSPRMALAQRAGIAVGDGILTDERLGTSAPAVFAAGDVAAALHPFYGRRLRVEHWSTAFHQPATAARAMLGKPARHERLPSFSSRQYDLGIEYVGHATSWDEVVLRRDAAGREVVAFWLEHGCVVAGMSVGVPGATDAIRQLIQTRRVVDPAELRDPERVLDDLQHGAGVKA